MFTVDVKKQHNTTTTTTQHNNDIRKKIRRRNKTHAMAKKTGSSKLKTKFESLRKEIKADDKKQHDLYVNNLIPETSTGILITQYNL